MDILILLYIVSVAFTGATGQQVEVEPEVFSYPGQTVNLRCAFTDGTGINLSSVTWSYESKEGNMINIAVFQLNFDPHYPDSPVKGRVSFSPSPPNLDSSSIQISDVRMTDDGNYICSIFTFPAGNKEGTTSLVILERVSNVTVTASSTDLVEFSSVSLSCSSSGSSLSFLWLNGSSEVTASDRVQLTDGNTTLTIVSVTRYDQGPFRCHVFNAVSNDTSAPINLSISFGPENIHLTKSPSQDYYVEGSDISLMCSAVSRPAALFNWFLNRVPLSDTGRELRLINIKEDQSGNYSCQAFNNKTMRNETSQPSVISVLKPIVNASVTSSPNQPVEGNSVKLTCEAAGSVFARKWMKDGADLIQTGRVLSFQSLKKTDSGKYSCNISNPVSSVEAEYIMVVNYGPENVQIKGPSTISLNENLTLTCSAESTPTANFSWKLNETKILNNSAVLTKHITDLSDSGEYTCEAMNRITEKTSSAVHGLTVTQYQTVHPSCSTGCIVGIVIACCVVIVVCILLVLLYIKKKKKSPNRDTGTRTAGEGQNNAAYSGSQELNYADIRFFQNKNGGTVNLGLQNNTSEYAEVRVNNGLPAVSSPPTYDAHMQRRTAPAP
ncbi:carcinoembryonic antigen-related cell adhesion molecule 1-like isoform X3 [Seriola aureovittata]|uniref:carcinoembryonic antigen-related cell adhesion molecule 1-like isoform X3 n=1 Tax=Seriola aureovittata TaxID=2871759 RepID=UPI0024BD7B46|nr:carcinoembryonic antigen-related cell adhesion molecule 1-like isoform X3 [Seriola aureovittata]